MKKKLTAFLLMTAAILITLPSFAEPGLLVVLPSTEVKTNTLPAENNWAEMVNGNPEVKTLSPDMLKMNLEKFLTLTPSKYKEMTGKKLGLKKSLELKAAQKFVKKRMTGSSGDIPKGLYVFLAIFGWGWLMMGIMDNWQGNDWWTNLILTFLCWIPGVIHAFAKMKKYYN